MSPCENLAAFRNGRARRSSRPAVVDTLLAVSATCRQQRRSVFAFLVEALTAARRGQPLPTLLPATTA